MAKGDYTQYRRQYQDISASTGISSGSTGSPFTLLTAKNANYQIYVQRIIVDQVVVTSTGATGSFAGGTGANIAVSVFPNTISSNAGVNSFEHDFGEDGQPLGLGKNLVMTITGTVPGLNVKVQAYQKLDKSIGGPGTTGAVE